MLRRDQLWDAAETGMEKVGYSVVIEESGQMKGWHRMERTEASRL